MARAGGDPEAGRAGEPGLSGAGRGGGRP
jgi:hypothetical protein